MMELLKKEKSTRLFSLPEFEEELRKQEPSWLQGTRTTARLRFAELGFPSVQDEDWKYTSVAPIAQTPFKPAGHSLFGLTRETINDLRFADLGAPRLVFVNGRFVRELSSLEGLDGGVRAESLAAVLQSDPQSLEPFLGRFADCRENAFSALNTALMTDGAFVYVPKGKVVDRPIHLLFISAAPEHPVALFPRNLIVAESNSQVSVVESYMAVDSSVYLTSPVTEIVARDAAVVEHTKMQSESLRAFHVAAMQYQLERGSSVTSNSMTLGGALIRNSLSAVLDGEGAECMLNGLYLVSGKQHIDNHTHLEHAAPHCSSRELYKGILDGQSRGVFHGRILVRRGAQKTDSKQTNNNLLLSDEALINTKPQLEIYADDVKCTHGATIGQMDRDALFYLRSRGIGEQSARSLMVYAFASEVVQRCKVGALRTQLDAFLMDRIPGNERVGVTGKQ